MKEFFSKKKFGLNYHEPRHFVENQWEWNSIIFLVYRVLSSAYLLTWLVLVAGNSTYNKTSESLKFFIFLTNQGYILLNTTFFLKAIFALVDFYLSYKVAGGKYPYSSMTWHFRVLWVFHNMACTISFFITIAYWTLLYRGVGADVYCIHVHGLNSVFSMIDLLICAIPHQFQHFYMPISFGLFYALFTIIYYEAGGTNYGGVVYIYKNVLDWRNGGKTAGILVACIFGIVIIHFLASLICYARIRFYHRRKQAYINNLQGVSNTVSLDLKSGVP